jgi:uncharacterized protein (TIGR02147 family)
VDVFIYEMIDYRKIIKDALLEKKSSLGTSFTFQDMAKACRVQKTYLSKVLNDRGHLNGDQLYLACEYLGFNGTDRDFIFLIFEVTRTVVEERRLELQAQINEIRRKQIKTESHLAANILPTSTADMAEYYLDPYLQIIHMFLTVEKYAKNAPSIAEVLNLHIELFAEALRKLQRLGIVEMRNGRYPVLKESIHLPKDSSLYRPYRNLLRMKSAEWVDKRPSEKSYNFSVIFSTSPQIKQRIHVAFLDFLKLTQDMVGEGKADEVYQMNFDLFGWSD